MSISTKYGQDNLEKINIVRNEDKEILGVHIEGGAYCYLKVPFELGLYGMFLGHYES